MDDKDLSCVKSKEVLKLQCLIRGNFVRKYLKRSIISYKKIKAEIEGTLSLDDKYLIDDHVDIFKDIWGFSNVERKWILSEHGVECKTDEDKPKFKDHTDLKIILDELYKEKKWLEQAILSRSELLALCHLEQ